MCPTHLVGRLELIKELKCLRALALYSSGSGPYLIHNYLVLIFHIRPPLLFIVLSICGGHESQSYKKLQEVASSFSSWLSRASVGVCLGVMVSWAGDGDTGWEMNIIRSCRVMVCRNTGATARDVSSSSCSAQLCWYFENLRLATTRWPCYWYNVYVVVTVCLSHKWNISFRCN